MTVRFKFIIRSLVLSLGVATTAYADFPWSSFPTPQFPQAPAPIRDVWVPGFSPRRQGLAFGNYDVWKKSSLPDALQLYHCTSMALLSRQVFLHARFEAGESALPPKEAENRIRSIYEMDAGKYPEAVQDRIPLPGFANLYEMSSDPAMVTAIQNALGDAYHDAKRPDWNWSVLDIWGWNPENRRRSELRAREEILRGLPVIFYLLDGTSEAHAVLAYAFRAGDGAEDGEVLYKVYDSNYPYDADNPEYSSRVMHFRLADGKMVYPSGRARDPFILYPYHGGF